MALTRYDVFLKVISNKSFSKAAEELGYTQSAVSQSINQMEKEMGFRLIDRSRNNLGLTPEGEMLFPYIEKASESERIIERKVREMKKMNLSIVNIGVSRYASCVLKPKILMEFSAKHPDIRINIISDNEERLQSLLDKSKVDFCVGEITEEDEGENVVLFKERYKVVLPEGHALCCEEYIEIDKLGPVCDRLSEGNEVRFYAGECGKKEAFQLLATNDIEIVLSMLESGFGIGLIPESLLERYNFKVVVKDTAAPVFRNIGLIFGKDTKISNSANALAEYLIEASKCLY